MSNQGQYKEAAERAVLATELDPGFVRAHARAGKACLCMGRWDQVRASQACSQAGWCEPLLGKSRACVRQGLRAHEPLGARPALCKSPVMSFGPRLQSLTRTHQPRPACA